MLGIVFFGALGGLSNVFAKVAFSGNNLVVAVFQSHCETYEFEYDPCVYGEYIVRLVGFTGIFACNAIGISYYLKAMEQNNTIVVVVVSSAANFLTTGLLGNFIFGEFLSRSWFFGSLLVMLGMCLVAVSQGQISPRKE